MITECPKCNFRGITTFTKDVYARKQDNSVVLIKLNYSKCERKGCDYFYKDDYEKRLKELKLKPYDEPAPEDMIKITNPIPKELEPLAEEARKYKNAEDFILAIGEKYRVFIDLKTGNIIEKLQDYTKNLKDAEDNLIKYEEMLKKVGLVPIGLSKKTILDRIKHSKKEIKNWQPRVEFLTKLKKQGIISLTDFYNQATKNQNLFTNFNNMTNITKELLKFDSYYLLENYLADKEYSIVLKYIVETAREGEEQGDKEIITKKIEGIILKWWNEPIIKNEHPNVKGFSPSYFLLWHLQKEIAEKEGIILHNPCGSHNPGNPDNPETKIEREIILDIGTPDIIDLQELKEEHRKDYNKLKKFCKDNYYIDDLDKLTENSPFLYTKEALQEEYLELSGIEERLKFYLDTEKMIDDDRMSGYLDVIEIDGIDYYYHTY